jgi:transcriptional regulator with XRE-family HTH domain
MSPDQIFVDRMLQLRKACGWTQTDLAKRMKQAGFPFHQQTVAKIENGERPVRLSESVALAGILGADLALMLGQSPSELDFVHYQARIAELEMRISSAQTALSGETPVPHLDGAS